MLIYWLWLWMDCSVLVYKIFTYLQLLSYTQCNYNYLKILQSRIAIYVLLYSFVEALVDCPNLDLYDYGLFWLLTGLFAVYGLKNGATFLFQLTPLWGLKLFCCYWWLLKDYLVETYYYTKFLSLLEPS